MATKKKAAKKKATTKKKVAKKARAAKAVARKPSAPKGGAADQWAAPQRGASTELTSHERAMLLTRREIAHMYGVTAAAITEWVKRGCPTTDFVDEHSKERYYNAREVLSWAVENIYGSQARQLKEGRTREDLRIKTLRADKLELEIREGKGDLVPFRDFIERYVDMVAASKAKLLAFPTRAAPHIASAVGIKEAAKIRKIESAAQEAVEEALRELADAPKAELLPDSTTGNDARVH